MATTAPSDPYKILGVDSSADAAAIKKAYRKLALTCHPDKVTDESLKPQKQEEFHQIQQAYETIGDQDSRTKYDLEVKAKKLREERDRAASKASTTQYRNVNINIHTATHPSEYRSSSSRYSPAKPASYKPYSAEFSKSCEHDIPNRSRAYQDEKKTRRVYSDERLNDDRKRDERERDRERERERAHRRRQQEEEDERRRRQLKREKEERELRERQRVKEAIKKREREQQEQDRIRAEIKAEKKAKERAELRRKQEAAEEKLRSKMRSQEHTSEEDDDRKSRSKKSSKKESARDKTPSKYRERSSPRDDPVPEVPSTADALESKMAYAALYIRGQQAKQKSSKSSSKHNADAPLFSDAYPDPEQWKPKRRVSGEKSKAAAEPIIVDATSPTISPASQPTHPRLPKSYTMGHVPGTSDSRPSFSRAQTFDPEAFARSTGSERPRMSRQRTSLDNDDYYTPRVQKYTVRPDRTVYETSQLRDPYVMPSGAFPKVKTAQAYGPEVVNQSKRYVPDDLEFADYSTANHQAYVVT